MLDVRGDALDSARLDDDVGGGIGAGDEAQRPGVHTQAAPRAAPHSMGAAQRVGHRALVPRRGGPSHGQALGDLAPVAERTVERGADASITLGCVLDPRRDAEGRAVAHVLAMVALEQRHPVTDVIDGEAGDPPHHAGKGTKAAVRRTHPVTGPQARRTDDAARTHGWAPTGFAPLDRGLTTWRGGRHA